MKIDRYSNMSASDIFATFGEDVSALRGSKTISREHVTIVIEYDRFLGRFSVEVFCGS